MSLHDALKPLLAQPGLVALLVSTRDGLPVEMIGHGLRSDRLAAQVASAAEASRRSFGELGMGEPLHVVTKLRDYDVVTFGSGDHYLTAVLEPDSEETLVPIVYESVLAPLHKALRGALGGRP